MFLMGSPIAQGKVGKENVIPELQSSMCSMYEENMEKSVLFLTVMSRDYR